ncbi:hypothetical protein FISHEDRAFT_32248 [Fistulina hepatica ATCC 64428]|uniref:GIT Spa2 homology (SHD) domain-containing protein n=1 Tax=Fistulina hepatica ATCC 64428 TaxID=1128425 RepID=A0A0D7AR12_9AGAR|nr:hypothetical protein FISHEDRAFT_32248 [Fistulina hepatica ATCC 64428]
MRRSQNRAPSPTPTSFSGISNYRTESYRPKPNGSSNVPAVPTPDFRSISKTYFDELSVYLAAYLARAAPNSRSSARQKLTRLTIQQFHELSTDVYDELVRRKSDKQGMLRNFPFLPVQDSFHPKRNQARQKLATLPTNRFEDLSSDVYFELTRRYPEFKEDVSGSAGERPVDGGYRGSSSSRQPSQERRRPSDAASPGRRSADAYRGRISTEANSVGHNYNSGSISSRRKPSVDVGYQNGRRPSAATSMSATSDSTATVNGAQSATATTGMIIPTKSTIEEEYIEVPYARGSSSTDREPRDRSQDPEADDSASEYPMSPPAGLQGLSARLQETRDEEDDDDGASRGARSGDELIDRMSMGRVSAASSDRSGVTGIGVRMLARGSMTEDIEKMRRDYEFKIATMQTQIATLQRELSDRGDRERQADERARKMEEELSKMRKHAEEDSAALKGLQKEHEELKEVRQREKERETRRAHDDEDELQILRDRCEKLEEEKKDRGDSGASDELVDQLRNDMEGLLSELQDLSKRNDELMTAKDADLGVIRNLDQQLKEYKRKYEQAKTELRSIKATSQLFLQGPKLVQMDEQLPVTPDGAILDIHATAFLTAIDVLLTAGRSNAPTRVLVPMKSVVNAVSSIIDDVRTFERRVQRDGTDLDLEVVNALLDRAEATLSNLVAASKTHATSAGMSPVSLLDAAASHVSATVTEMVKTVYVRKATKAESDEFLAASPAPTPSSSYSRNMSSVDEGKGYTHSRLGSTAAQVNGRYGAQQSQRRRALSPNSSSDNTNSPPPIFDQPTGGQQSDDSAAESPEDAWAELKVAQTESIVYAIQSVLSGVRSPTPSPNLNDHLTQIITIVSSIVAVCKDNLPPASTQQGEEILRELSDHANKLSEVQAAPEITKETRQIMAKSSFAVANAMKGLMKL